MVVVVIAVVRMAYMIVEGMLYLGEYYVVVVLVLMVVKVFVGVAEAIVVFAVYFSLRMQECKCLACCSCLSYKRGLF